MKWPTASKSYMIKVYKKNHLWEKLHRGDFFMQLTEKEKSLLKDMKDTEKLCIEKYTQGAQNAKDPCLP